MSISHKTARFNLRHAVASLCVTGAAAFSASPALAAVGVPGVDVYVGAGVGQSDADVSVQNFDKTDLAWNVFAGVRAFSFLGAELDYIDFGKPSGGGADFKYKGIAGYGLYYLPIPLPVLDVYLKAGLARVDINPSFAASTNDTKFTFGGGVQLKFGSWAVRGEYSQFKMEGVKPTLLSLGFSKSFL